MNNALIIVDVWDDHWDTQTRTNLDSLATDINNFASVVRSNGDLVIHAPSKVTRQYKKKSIKIDHKYNLIENDKLVNKLNDLNFPLILDGTGTPNWSKQHTNIQIDDADYISANGSEIFNLLKKFGIKNLYYCGVHANICILWTRQFSILQMQNNGIDTTLIEDLSMSLPVNQYDKLLSFYNKHICKTILKKELYA
jgi:nicotinamidase-related amidase